MMIGNLSQRYSRIRSTVFILTAVVVAVLYATLSVVRHDRYQSGGFDLGLYDQAVWQYSRFIWPYNTVKERFILGDHLTLTLPLLAPLYWISPDVRMLLIFQAMFIVASMYPIYRLGRVRQFSEPVSFAISLLYILFYGIQYGVFFDFHPVMIGVGLLAWLCYFLESGHVRMTLLTLILVVCTQENMPIAVSCLGLIYAFRPKFRRVGIGFVAGGILSALLASRIIAWLSPVGFQYWPAINLDPVHIFRSFWDSPEKRQVWLYTFSWFSFLPLLSPGTVLAVTVDLAQYFVTGSEFSRMWSPFMHHRAILSVFITLGVYQALEYLRLRTGRIAVITAVLVTSAAVQQYVFHLPLNKLAKPSFWRYENWMSDNRMVQASIPKDASLAAQQSLVPHVSHRREIYIVWPRMHDIESRPCGQVSCWWLDFGGRPDYLYVDLHPHQWLTQLLETNEHFESAVENMEIAGRIRLEKEVGRSRLYRVYYPEN
jgi:uncharacterized membrane protein